MTLPPPKVCKRIRKLHAQIGSSGKDADVAKQKLSQLLSEHGLTWNDLPTFFAAIEPCGAADSSNDAATVPAAARPEPHVLAVVLRLIEEHIAVTAEERLAVALWILHAHVFDRFFDNSQTRVVQSSAWLRKNDSAHLNRTAGP